MDFATVEKVALAGDWHGRLLWAELMIERAHEADVKLILQLGDFGVWQDNQGQKYLYRVNKLLTKLDMYVLVTLGNHENYTMVDNFVEIREGDWKGFKFDPKNPRIMYFQRGQVLTLNGVNFISLGGANSIDKFNRVEYRSWWPGEQISTGDMYRTQENALALEGGVDVFLAHDVFASARLWENHRSADMGWSVRAFEYAQQSRDSLQLVAEVVKPKMWFHGHYHRRMELETTLKDVQGNPFTIKSYCLDRDNSGDNLIMLSLPNMEVEWYNYKWKRDPHWD
jgi:hypothetical protein